MAAKNTPTKVPALKTYVCTNFDGFFPVGTSSVIVARDKRHARSLLCETLSSHGLPVPLDRRAGLEIQLLDQSVAHAVILQDGNY
jgi:hypothetical protein